MTHRQQRRRAYRRGVLAELACAAYLLAKGYWPLVRRYRSAKGEIDLICRKGGTIVYIEVKYRRRRDEGLSALQPRQLERVRAAAEIFLARHPKWAALDQRIDLVVILPKNRPIHVKNLI